jgi:hypothetical protein
LAIGWVAAAGLASAACSSEEGNYGGDVKQDEPDASFFPATGGAPAGTGGFPAGTGGSSDPIGSTGGGSTGTCNAAFCPEVMGGMRCCVAANGPCGVDLGNGCVSSTMNDGGP